MNKGFLDAIFATTTVAAGVNYPARTIVMLNSDIFNGHEFMPLRGTEFHQMTGRAGRRGQDRIGFLLVIPGRFMDLEHIARLLKSGPDRVESQIRADFSMVLNLLLSQTPEDIRQILTRSFAAYQRGDTDSLWRDVERHIRFLKAEGFVDEQDHLTPDGVWASQLRLDEPLLIAECLRRGAFPDDPSLLAAVVAPFAYDGDQEMKIAGLKGLPPKLMRVMRRVLSVIRPLQKRLTEQAFPVHPLLFWPAHVMYDWARGHDWDDVVERWRSSDGELAMLVLRTADNLRQIRSLGVTYPDIAHRADEAIMRILREPVVY